MATNRLAVSVTYMGLPAFNSDSEISSLPTPSADAPAVIKAAVVSRLTPPVGISGMWGRGPRRAWMDFGPPTLPHGKTLTKSDPPLQSFTISLGVSAPAIINLPALFASLIVSRSNTGLTRNWAPESRHR